MSPVTFGGRPQVIFFRQWPSNFNDDYCAPVSATDNRCVSRPTRILHWYPLSIQTSTEKGVERADNADTEHVTWTSAFRPRFASND